MFVKKKLPVCLAAATLIAGGALAQDSPSWRAAQEQPSRPEVPPEIERPEYEFSVSRDELMGFVPRAQEAANPEPQSPSAEPQRLESDSEYGTAEMVPAGLAVEPPRSTGDATGGASIAPEEAFAGTHVGQPESSEPSFDTDPPPIPMNASAVAIETEPVAAGALVDRGPETKDGARFAVSEMAGEEPGSIDASARDRDLVPALDEQAGLAYVDAGAAPPSELESIDQRAPIAAAFETGAAHEGTALSESDPQIAGALAPDAVTYPPFDDAEAWSPTVDFHLVRRQTVEPEYPRHAYRARLEGWVNLRVTVAPNGVVENVEVTDAKPRRVFNESAIRAVRQWRFEPPQLAGVSTSQSGLYRISYTLRD